MKFSKSIYRIVKGCTFCFRPPQSKLKAAARPITTAVDHHREEQIKDAILYCKQTMGMVKKANIEEEEEEVEQTSPISFLDSPLTNVCDEKNSSFHNSVAFAESAPLHPSPLKSSAQIVDVSGLPLANEDESPVERNGVFHISVREPVVELLGTPAVEANGELEALGAQLNSRGFGDACITSDSDALLYGYGAECVIKSVPHNSEERKERKLNWHIGLCKKRAREFNFPNNEINDLCLRGKNENDASAPRLSWESPKTIIVDDFLTYHLPWEPFYTRKRILPMLSTIVLRRMAVNQTETLLRRQYVFDSIQHVKVRYCHQFYVVSWMKNIRVDSCSTYEISSEGPSLQPEEVVREEDINSILDEPDVPQVLVDEGCCFILTDEYIDLVLKASPENVSSSIQQKADQEELPANSEAAGTTNIAASSADRFVVPVDFKPVEPLPEPRDNDQPIMFPFLEPSIVNVHEHLDSPLQFMPSLLCSMKSTGGLQFLCCT